MLLSAPVIKVKADKRTKSLGLAEFNPSNGWLDKLKKLYGIKEKVISKESRCQWWRLWSVETRSFEKNLEDYTPDDNIFKADKNALFFECIPTKILTFKNYINVIFGENIVR